MILLGDTSDDDQELFNAMLDGMGWLYFLVRFVRPEIERIRRVLVTNENLSEKEHYANVMLLRSYKRILDDAYKGVETELPSTIQKWFT